MILYWGFGCTVQILHWVIGVSMMHMDGEEDTWVLCATFVPTLCGRSQNVCLLALPAVTVVESRNR